MIPLVLLALVALILFVVSGRQPRPGHAFLGRDGAVEREKHGATAGCAMPFWAQDKGSWSAPDAA